MSYYLPLAKGCPRASNSIGSCAHSTRCVVVKFFARPGWQRLVITVENGLLGAHGQPVRLVGGGHGGRMQRWVIAI